MDKPIRILFTTSNFNKAGSGKVIYDLIKGLDKAKFEITIACGDNLGEFFKVIETLNVPIHIFKTKTSYRPYYGLFFRVCHISKFYRTHQFDIIHSWQWSSDWTEALAAKFAGIKWIYTKKAMGYESKHWKLKSYLANFIVTINAEMQSYFPNKKQQALIPLGIDTTYYNPELFEDKISDETSKFKIITVANLVPVKGIEVLIKALKILNNENIVLTIVGDHNNSYGNALLKMVTDLKLNEYVVFLGKKADVRHFISKSDVYVIPTLDEGRKEGMPMALVEAMSMGIPVIGSNVSGINFVLKDFKNLLFKAGDSNSLAKKIDDIKNLTDLERKQLGNTLRSYCMNHFSLTNFIKAHEQLYIKLLKK
ncbi:glycosyltransferase [Winogradskyella sp. R77965]|uniref:glycosyltransferase n=1 Tax=Winogradskyella sp. R77965 TaxID=3093872 RepID=UPI0037DD007E